MAKSKDNFRMPGMRVFSFSAAGVLGLLLVSGTMPAVFGDSTDRAIIDAPVDLITSPIKGVVGSLTITPGDSVVAGQSLAVVQDNAVDPAKLIELNLKAAELDSRIANDSESIQNLQRAIAGLDAQILEQRTALFSSLQQDIASATENLAMKSGKVDIAAKTYQTQETLHTSGLGGGNLQNWASEVEIAKSDAGAAEAGVTSARDRLAASGKGVYLGPDAASLNALLQEKRESGSKLDLLTAEITSLQTQRSSVDAFRDEEKLRVARISESRLAAPTKGQVLNVNVHNGSAVSSGDAIARTVNCQQTFVSAIFPEQKASNLAAGAAVTVTSAGWATPIAGTITQLVPRDNAGESNNFAVPFPPTERRELYAYIHLANTSDAIGNGTCAVGKWVSVSIDNGVIPAASDLVRSTGGALSATAARLYSSASQLFPPKAGVGLTTSAVASEVSAMQQYRIKTLDEKAALQWAVPALARGD